MSRFQRTSMHCLALAGLICSATVPATAQEWDSAGVVRITDNVPPEPVPEGTPVPSKPCPNCPNGSGEMVYIDGQYCPGECPDGCYHGCGHYSRCLHRIIDWFNPHGMCTFSPDHGWAPPVKRPIYRSPVVYKKGFSDALTGAPSGPQVRVPTVYMPTDTTQLGYYYQHVPYWLPQPGAIPPAPVPRDWHVSLCDVEVPGHKHPAGVIIGTAPRIMGPTVTPGTVTYSEVGNSEPTPAQGSSAGLEKTSSSPILQPIR